jgi:glycosyltransferase involved in cell wall biosynthesis
MPDRRSTEAATDPRNPVRVAFITHSGALSGAELALVRQLGNAQAIEPVVLVGEEGPLVERLRAAGVPTRVVPLAARARDLRRTEVGGIMAVLRSLSGSLRWAVALRRALQRTRPDVVETGSMKAHFLGGLAARSLGLPVVWRAHDLVDEPYLPRPAVMLTRTALRVIPQVVLANSHATAASLHVAAHRVLVVPPPVPPVAAAEGGGIEPLVVGHVGRLAPWKGQDVFLRAFAEAFGNGSEVAVVVGAPLFGEDDYAAGLERLCADLGIADRVRLLGFRDDIPELLSSFDMLVHTSVLPEPLGQVVIEGMSAGLAVVAAAAGGPAEIVTDGVDGLLVPPGDVRALAQALRRLAEDPSLRAALGTRGREMSGQFAPDVVVPRLESVYQAAAAGSRTGKST